MSPSKCDADIIFLDETDDSPNMRGRSQTWSFTKPPKRIAKEPIVKEKSVEDIFNELLESANEFMEEPEDLFGFRYEDLSDIEEGVQKCFNLDDFDQTSPGSVNQRSPVEHKKKTDLAKICGFQSYHHIIEKAIHCSPDKMLTLNQIYSWIEENIPYFRSLTESKNSKGWKNSVRHNLSLHKQFYRVLREGQRACLWACDMNRIRNEKVGKLRKISHQPQQAEHSIPTFRPRSKTDPTAMIRPTIKNLRNQNEENIVKPIFNSLSSRFEAIEAKKKQACLENVHWAHDLSLTEQCRNSNSYTNVSSVDQFNTFNDFNRQTLTDSNHDVSNAPQMAFTTFQNTSLNNSSIMTPVQDISTSFIPNHPSISYPFMTLDDQAIIEHEKHLYEVTP